jgi:aspartyl-tRNA(Asn)/glutamyl-tRNA(Gln) amidotransferase subunit C
MAIDKDDVRHVAELARLALTEDELLLYTAQLKRILGYIEKLSELDTTGVVPTFYSATKGSMLREDKAGECLDAEDALKNAPAQRHGCFKVQRIIE